jgi:oligopeptide/dipeptide ABC transporter ATP-binding protein
VITKNLLDISNLEVSFPVPGGIVRAVRGLSLSVGSGEIVGLVGETGSGKTTVGKAVMRLVQPSAGSISIDGTDITTLSRRALRPMRQRVQMVFQDPYSSLNPRMSIATIVEDPLRINGIGSKTERRHKVREVIEQVGLTETVLQRYPGEMSGGQRQRVGIARALILSPELLVADEPVSALDVSVQAGILNLLVDLQQTLGFSCLFITHDLNVAEHLSDRVAVMYLGEIVEIGTRDEVLMEGAHPYTQSLLGSVLTPDPQIQRSRERSTLPGDPPDPLTPPTGCSLHPRCPVATDYCSTVAPTLQPLTANRSKETTPAPNVSEPSSRDHLVSCHYVGPSPRVDSTLVQP